VHIKVKKGLDIPIDGQPSGSIEQIRSSGQAAPAIPSLVSLNLSSFDNLRVRLFKKVGDNVQIGEPICEDKGTPGRYFVSPAAGIIKEIRRGLKRRIIDIVIERSEHEEYYTHGPLDPETASREAIIERLLKGGVFTKINQRPFCLLADPTAIPKAIFVKAIESAPFLPPAEMQVEGYESAFHSGLTALKKLTEGAVHLVYKKGSRFAPFTNAAHTEKHTVEGPHPAGTHSLHIQQIDPINSAEDVIWTLTAHDVVCIGQLLNEGKHHIERIIAIAGPGIIDGQRGFFRVREGLPIALIAAGRIAKNPTRLISGDPLMGSTVSIEDFLGYQDYAFTAIPLQTSREILHFLRLGVNKYSYTRAYASGHLSNKNHKYSFTTSQHGEHRAFVDPTLYDDVMALNVPTMQLVKAIMADDFDLAETLGLLEVHPEDFALPAFVCISKIDMPEIVQEGLRAHAADMLE